MAANPLEALYAQLLAGGTDHLITPMQVQGPNIPGMSVGGDGGDDAGGMGGFEALAGGVLDYIDKKQAKSEAERGTSNQSAWQNPEMFPGQRPPERPAGPMPPGDMGGQAPQAPQGPGQTYGPAGGPPPMSPPGQTYGPAGGAPPDTLPGQSANAGPAGGPPPEANMFNPQITAFIKMLRGY
jgi:hypothetical protein